MKLLELNTHEFAGAAKRIAFWPVGTIEAHDLGPLGTDVIAPEKVATDLASRFNALLLPTLPFGLVSTLAGHPGGMWLSEETYKKMIRELVASLSISSISQLIVFNGHGGNSSALASALGDAWKESRIKCACIDWWTLAEDISQKHFGSAGGHAGADELAVVFAVNPALTPPSWDGSRAYRMRPGCKTYPAPRSALRFTDGPALPFTAESARTYYNELLQRLDDVVSELLQGWHELEG